jgi:hypothetical protein
MSSRKLELFMSIGISRLHITFQAEWVKEILGEVDSLLEFDVDAEDFLPLELRRRLLRFLESPSEFFGFDSKLEVAGGASECRIILKPSDSFLNLLLALRAWNRNREVTV